QGRSGGGAGPDAARATTAHRPMAALLQPATAARSAGDEDAGPGLPKEPAAAAPKDRALEISGRMGAVLGERKRRDELAGPTPLCGRGVCAGLRGTQAERARAVARLFWAAAGRRTARKGGRERSHGAVCAAGLTLRVGPRRYGSLRSPSLCGPTRSVSDVLSTFVSDVLRLSTASPYLAPFCFP